MANEMFKSLTSQGQIKTIKVPHYIANKIAHHCVTNGRAKTKIWKIYVGKNKEQACTVGQKNCQVVPMKPSTPTGEDPVITLPELCPT